MENKNSIKNDELTAETETFIRYLSDTKVMQKQTEKDILELAKAFFIILKKIKESD